MPEKSFIVYVSDDTRYRFSFVREKRKIFRFVIQLELFLDDKWIPIVRYDDAHGFVHRDLYHADGTKEKLPIANMIMNEAMTFAERDLKQNWKIYRERFLGEYYDKSKRI